MRRVWAAETWRAPRFEGGEMLPPARDGQQGNRENRAAEAALPVRRTRWTLGLTRILGIPILPDSHFGDGRSFAAPRDGCAAASATTPDRPRTATALLI